MTFSLCSSAASLALFASLLLHTLGLAPAIQDLHGIAQFTDDELASIEKQMAESSTPMPAFGTLGRRSSHSESPATLPDVTPKRCVGIRLLISLVSVLVQGVVLCASCCCCVDVGCSVLYLLLCCVCLLPRCVYIQHVTSCAYCSVVVVSSVDFLRLIPVLLFASQTLPVGS